MAAAQIRGGAYVGGSLRGGERHVDRVDRSREGTSIDDAVGAMDGGAVAVSEERPCEYVVTVFTPTLCRLLHFRGANTS